MGCNPWVKKRKAEFPVSHRCHDQLEGGLAGAVQIESVHEEKRISGSESYPFVAIQKVVIIDQRLQQRRRLFASVPHRLHRFFASLRMTINGRNFYRCSKSTGAVTSCTRKYFASAGYLRATASYMAYATLR